MSALITAEGLVRLDAALAWIDEHPEQHDQDAWVRRYDDTVTGCGTTMCLAGVGVMLAGAVPEWASENHITTAKARTSSGEVREIPELAAELFGIDRYGAPASNLFYSAVTRRDLAEARDRLAESLEPTP